MLLWRTRQFEYQWLRTLAGRYEDFMETTQEALSFSARSLRLDLTPEKRDRLMRPWLELTIWPDVAQATDALKRSGLR